MVRAVSESRKVDFTVELHFQLTRLLPGKLHRYADAALLKE